tara:strand:- start:1540 stop:2025 length:486 start_codon:yes stop_codon:yes gene_type:complete
MKITDDTLDKEYFSMLQGVVMGHNFPWEYQARVANPWENNNDHFYFVHRLYERFSPVSSFMEPLDDYLIKVLNVKSIIRARVLLYPNQGKFIEHDPHIDFEYSHNAALLYFNDNDGFTRMEDGTKVESVANRNVIFDGSTSHNSTNCTTEKARFVLAVNYF